MNARTTALGVTALASLVLISPSTAASAGTTSAPAPVLQATTLSGTPVSPGQVLAYLPSTPQGCEATTPIGIDIDNPTGSDVVDGVWSVSCSCVVTFDSLSQTADGTAPATQASAASPAAATITTCGHQGWSKITALSKTIFINQTSAEVRLQGNWHTYGPAGSKSCTGNVSPITVNFSKTYMYCYFNPLIDLTQGFSCNNTTGGSLPTVATAQNSGSFVEGTVGSDLHTYWLNASIVAHNTGVFGFGCSEVDQNTGVNYLPPDLTIHCTGQLTT